MTGLSERLIYGTGHLVGGPDSGQARHLLDVVRKAGVTRFDTAPLYGLGTAESVLGRHFGGDPAVTITTKVGLARPGWPLARAWARKGVRLLRGGAQGHAGGPLATAPGSGVSISGQFDVAFMRHSLAQSVAHLGRYPDGLLLHEYAAPSAEAEEFLHDLLADGRLRQVGYANGASFDVLRDAAMPAGWLAQAAAPAALLLAPVSLSERPLNLHSLVGMGRWLAQTEPAYARGLAAVTRQFTGLVAADQWPIVLPYCLAAVHAPQAGLIYATAQAARAAAFLSALVAIEREQALPAIHATATATTALGQVG